MRSIALTATAVMLLVLAGTATAADLFAIPEVTPDSSGVTSVTLTVDAARVSVEDGFTITTRSYYYDGTPRIHGPTLVVQAGGTLKISLINNLKDDTANDANRAMNTWRHANTTNIHTHGLHVDPAIDSVFRHAAPGGGTLSYEYPIPADHSPGMHWYHAHTHGSSTMQIMGGLVGAIYVKALARDNIPASISGITSHLMVMQLFNFANSTTQSCYPDQASFDPFKLYSFSELEQESGSNIRHSVTFASTTFTGPVWTINGQYQPTVTMAPSESRLFKLVYAAGALAPKLHFPSACTVQNIAFDGVYFNGAPRTVASLQLVTASRVEFVMQCSSAGSYVVTATNTGNTNNVATSGGTTVFKLTVTGSTASSTSLPSSLASIKRPAYLDDLRSLTKTDKTNQVSLNQGGHPDCMFVLGQGSDCSTPAGGPPAPRNRRQQVNTKCPATVFTGQRGLTAAAHRFSMTVGETAEFKIIGAGANPHPLHIHVNHYQITSYTGTDAVLNNFMQVGDWRDTIPVLDGTTTVRFRADLLPGETILHCHILAHEDRGLMDSFLIMPSANNNTYTNTGKSSAASASVAAVIALALSVVLVIA